MENPCRLSKKFTRINSLTVCKLNITHFRVILAVVEQASPRSPGIPQGGTVEVQILR